MNRNFVDKNWLQYLVDGLRDNDWPECCQENIDAAIVHLDCARQNLIDSEPQNTTIYPDINIKEFFKKIMGEEE